MKIPRYLLGAPWEYKPNSRQYVSSPARHLQKKAKADVIPLFKKA
jgi:hypothetical protein